MEIATRIEDIGLDLSQGCHVTVGNFDGMHVGHQALVDGVVARAKAAGGVSAAITFFPHPRKVLGVHVPSVSAPGQKMKILRSHGLDLALELEFTPALAALSPEEFVRRYLVQGLKARSVVVGYDFSFGHRRTGNFEALEALGQEHGFEAKRLGPVLIGGVPVSSTRIRELILAGEVWDARPLLGRLFALQGRVVHGQNRGRKLLHCPTANLKPENGVLPAPGVYAVWVEVDGKLLPGAASVGNNPTFSDSDESASVEAHLLDFEGDLYDRELLVHFVLRLRPQKQFASPELLAARIEQDLSDARRILSDPGAHP
jgi:riboflavin kinase / FMN adenylyltransferase